MLRSGSHYLGLVHHDCQHFSGAMIRSQPLCKRNWADMAGLSLRSKPCNDRQFLLNPVQSVSGVHMPVRPYRQSLFELGAIYAALCKWSTCDLVSCHLRVILPSVGLTRRKGRRRRRHAVSSNLQLQQAVPTNAVVMRLGRLRVPTALPSGVVLCAEWLRCPYTACRWIAAYSVFFRELLPARQKRFDSQMTADCLWLRIVTWPRNLDTMHIVLVVSMVPPGRR